LTKLAAKLSVSDDITDWAIAIAVRSMLSAKIRPRRSRALESR